MFTHRHIGLGRAFRLQWCGEGSGVRVGGGHDQRTRGDETYANQGTTTRAGHHRYHVALVGSREEDRRTPGLASGPRCINPRVLLRGLFQYPALPS